VESQLSESIQIFAHSPAFSQARIDQSRVFTISVDDGSFRLDAVDRDEALY
jgi:hypothetical protein